jgi:hypothetical protein
MQPERIRRSLISGKSKLKDVQDLFVPAHISKHFRCLFQILIVFEPDLNVALFQVKA